MGSGRCGKNELGNPMNNFLITLVSGGIGIVIVGCLVGAAWLLDTYSDHKDIKEWKKKNELVTKCNPLEKK